MAENNKKANSAKKGTSKAQRKESPEDKARRSLSVARRSIWYILRVIVIIILCALLCYGAFLEAMYVSSIYIIVTEGMEMRADCILGNISSMELREHFSKDWLLNDGDLDAGKYDAFRVDSYDYRLSIKKFKVLPWSKKATLQVIERVVNIQAAPYSDDTTDPVPEWVSTRMEIELEKVEGRWYITKLTVLETNRASGFFISENTERRQKKPPFSYKKNGAGPFPSRCRRAGLFCFSNVISRSPSG